MSASSNPRPPPMSPNSRREMKRKWRRCSLSHCRKSRSANFRLFKFPNANSPVGHVWRVLCGYPPQAENMYICESHFPRYLIGTKYLKRDAIPSINLTADSDPDDNQQTGGGDTDDEESRGLIQMPDVPRRADGTFDSDLFYGIEPFPEPEQNLFHSTDDDISLPLQQQDEEEEELVQPMDDDDQIRTLEKRRMELQIQNLELQNRNLEIQYFRQLLVVAKCEKELGIGPSKYTEHLQSA